MTGKFGSGKTFLITAHLIQSLKQNRFDRIVYMRNTVPVKNIQEIGYLPGDELSKLAAYAMPVADALGGKDGLNALIVQNKLEIQSLGSIRGRDYRAAGIFVSEAENLTPEHIQLIISRIGKDSVLYLDGDCQQTDKAIFETNNGLKKTIDVLKNNKLFGYVQLQHTERSETAALADLFD